MFKPAKVLIRRKSTSIFYAVCYSTPVLFSFIFYPQFVNVNVQFSIIETIQSMKQFKAFINSWWICIKTSLYEDFFDASFSKLSTDPLYAIIFIIFWHFLMFYQIFLSPQVKRCAIITYKYGLYELPHELRNNLRLRKLENIRKVSKLQYFDGFFEDIIFKHHYWNTPPPPTAVEPKILGFFCFP